MKLKDLKVAFQRPYGYFSYPLLSFISILILFIIIREPLLRYYIDKKIDSYNQKHNTEISYSSLSFNGLTSITLHDFSLKEVSKEPIINASSIKIKVSFWKLFLQRISIENIEIKTCYIQIIKNKNTSNYSFLFKQKNEDNDNSNNKKSISDLIDRLSNKLFDLIPNKLSVDQLSITLVSNSHKLTLALPKLEIINRNFVTRIEMNELGNSTIFNTEGVLDKENQEIALKIYGDKGEPFVLPWIKQRNNALLCFDTAYFKVKHEEKNSDEKESITGSGSLTNLQIYHKRLADDTIVFKNLKTDYTFNFGSDYVEFDSSSTVTINNLTLNPYCYFRPKPSKRIYLSLYKPFFNASELFSSLPGGLFDNFTGIEVDGQLSYFGLMDLDLAIPDSLIFKSDLYQKEFKITKPGATDFKKVNNLTYQHTVFEKDKEVKKIVIGPSNPNFIAFERIPVSLKNSLLMSEDGWFFEHGGFSLGAFRESIITNIKTKQFTRGGSTISMQLIKNLFLNRKKNVARKMEELLIVWIIEKQRLVSKERMFEIYVNIIEWGPGIYGIAEASRYYFNKDVSALTLDESIYLAAIIPSPKNYKYLFNEDGTFKEYIKNHYQLVLRRMVEHEMITQQQADAALIHVIFSEELKNKIKEEKEKKQQKNGALQTNNSLPPRTLR